MNPYRSHFEHRIKPQSSVGWLITQSCCARFASYPCVCCSLTNKLLQLLSMSSVQAFARVLLGNNLETLSGTEKEKR